MPTPCPKPSDASEAAVAAVIRELTRFPKCQALACELEAALAHSTGLSIRQARRHIRLAVISGGGVARMPKGFLGTVYCLAKDQGHPAAAITAAAPRMAPWLAAVPCEFRRDVALAVLALGAAGGEAMRFDLVRAVAALAQRPLLWAVTSVDAAMDAVGRKAIHQRRVGPAESDVAYALADGTATEGMEAWARGVDFRLPTDHAALELRLRRAIGHAAIPLTPGQTEVLHALAALGGTATAEELYGYGFCYGQRYMAIGVVGTLRDAATRPAWVSLEGGKRFRLAAGLW